MHLPLLSSVTAFWDGSSFCFWLRVVFFLATGSAFWRTRHYDPPYFNDCRWRLREESLPVAGGALPVAKKVLPVAVAGPRPCRIAVYVTRTAVGVDGQTSTAMRDAIIGLP